MLRLPRPRFTGSRLMIAVVLVGLIVGGVVGSTQNQLTVENRSGQALSWIRVAVTGSSSVAWFRDGPDEGVVSSTFRIGGDGHFQVNGRLADGTRLEGNFGYVTSGMSGQRARFVIRPGGKIDFDGSH